MPNQSQDKLREALAEYAHEAWSGWMRYLFEKGRYEIVGAPNGMTEAVWIMPSWAVSRWGRQLSTPYAELLEIEKESDRKEADAMIAIMRELWRSDDGYTEAEMLQSIKDLVAEVGEKDALIAALTEEVTQAKAWETWHKHSREIGEQIIKQQVERIEKLSAEARNWEKAVQDLAKVSLDLVDDNAELKRRPEAQTPANDGWDLAQERALRIVVLENDLVRAKTRIRQLEKLAQKLSATAADNVRRDDAEDRGYGDGKI